MTIMAKRICALVACVLVMATVAQAATLLACNTQANLAAESGVYPFNTSTNFASPIAATLTSAGALQLTISTATETAFAGWLSSKYRVVNGFRASFSFVVSDIQTTTTDGFAFVLQSTSTIITGDSSANLGYHFANSIAVEFDMYTDTTITDTAGNNHVEVHTAYSGTNTASDESRLPTAAYDPGVTMNDGTVHNVVINYIPASTSSSSHGNITMRIDSGPLLSTAINTTLVNAMFADGLSYIGFTGSTSDTLAANIFITDFAFYTIPVDASQTYVVNNSLSSGKTVSNAISSTAQGQVQLVDKCGSLLSSSFGSKSILTATLTTDGSTASSNGSASTTDLSTGLYNIFWWNSVASIPSTSLYLGIQYNGASIKNSPFTVQVVPGLATATSSTVSPSIPTTYTAGVTQFVVVTMRDIYGNAAPLPSTYSIRAGFTSPTTNYNTYNTSNALTTTKATYNVSLLSTQSQTAGSVYINLYSGITLLDSISSATVAVVAASPYGTNSVLSGTGLSLATAGVLTTVSFALEDVYSNPVTTTTGVTVAGTLTSTTTGSVVALNVSYSSSNVWSLSYTITTADYYTLAATVNGQAAAATGYLSVQAAAVTRGDITAAIAQGTAGAPSTFTIQAYDVYSNARTIVNPTGSDFLITLTSGSYSDTINCTTAVTPTTNSYLTSFTCTYSESGAYTVSVVSTKATNYTIGLALQGGPTSTLTYNTLTVKPADPSASESVLSGLSTSTAGIASTFILTVYDEYGNLRTGYDDRAYFTLYQLLMSSTAANISSVTPQYNGNYTFTYTAKLAGTYTVSVRISGNAVSISGSSTTLVVPGVFVPSASKFSGDGIVGGVTGETATFTAQAYDGYSNKLLLASNSVNSFYSTSLYVGVLTTNADCTADTSTGGLYTCTYTVPTYSSSPTFILAIYGRVAGGTGQLAGNYTVTDSEDTDVSNALASLSNTTYIRAGVTNVFNITDYDQSDPPVKKTTSSVTFEVTFTAIDSDVSATDLTADCGTGSSITTCNPKYLTYSLDTVGNYTVRIYADGIQTQQSKAYNFRLVVEPGVASAGATIFTVASTSVVAGETFSFTAQLVDASGNHLTSGGDNFTFPYRTSYTAPVVVDNGDGTYSFTTSFTGSGPQTITPYLNGVATGGIALTVTVGAVSGTTTSITAITTPMIAGAQSNTLTIILRDAYSNVISDATCSMTLTNNPDMVSSVSATLATFTPFVSDYTTPFTAAFFCNNVSISNQSVQVMPAAVNASLSTIIGLENTTFTSSVLANFSLQLQDSYGNPWYSSDDTVVVEYSAVIDYTTTSTVSDVTATVTLNEYISNGGYYWITFTPTLTGNYSFMYTSGSTAFTPANGVNTVLVKPGAVSMSKSSVPTSALRNTLSSGDAYDAGTVFSTLLTLRDALSNPLTTGGLADDITLVFYERYQTSTTSYCLSGKKDTSMPVQSNFSSSLNEVIDNGNGTYTLQIYTTVAGQFWFDIVYNGDSYITNSNCVSIGTLTGFAIKALSASAPNTVLSSILSGRAGDTLSFTVTLYDKYDNLVVNTGHVLSTGNGSMCANNTDDYPALSFATSDAVVTNTSSTLLTVTFQVNVSDYYVVPLLLDGTLTSSDGTCPSIYVKPAYVSSADFASAVLIAGVSSVLTLQTYDKFGNAIYTPYDTTTTPVYTVNFTRVAGSAYNISNTSVYTDDTAYSTVPISFQTDGWMDVTIALPADPLDSTTAAETMTTTVYVSPASCAVADSTKPYRCSTGTCVSSYSQCVNYTECSGVICPGTTDCVASLSSCDTSSICSGTTVFCVIGVNQGYCTQGSTCPAGQDDNLCAYQGLVSCGSGICRQSESDCPSQKVCPPFTYICPDGVSCAADTDNCPPLASTECTSPQGYQCRDGHCVGRAEDCPSETTCSGTNVLCPDGTCRNSTAECTETFTCLFGLIKCSNGECRERLLDCPTRTTCEENYVMCENGECRATVDECSAATQCSGGVRCADGTCRSSAMQCPTLITCPTTFPVRCSDGRCVRDLQQCPASRECPDDATIRCPDGTCVQFNTSCPTTVSCPTATPTRCPDGSCVDIIDDCLMASAPPPSCPPFRPYRCSDSSCRGNATDCPTKQIKCWDYAPVMCPDHTCVVSADMCRTAGLAACAAGQTRCPNGGCAWSSALCPTQVTCGPGYMRGTDGSCRVEVQLTNSSTIGLYTAGSSADCTYPKMLCPQNHQGFTCANSLTDCPQDVTCPSDKPVRCSDASCAQSLADCYPVVTIRSTIRVCPASTSTSSSTCGASTTCPASAPTKCWDESCRILPEDCPPQAACDTDNYFLCPTGECVSSPLSCTPGQRCTTASLPVKCPWTPSGVNHCVNNATSCVNIFTALPSITCPDSYTRCRDGHCALDSSSCNSLTCPSEASYVCPDGLCARTVDECNAQNGCPFYASTKCWDGSCVASSSSCTTTTNCTTSSYSRCADGSCQASCPTNATGCDDGYTLCADGQCASSADDCVDNLDDYNACPAWRPYRCADGYCARSAYLCPIMPLPTTLLAPITSGTLTRSILCASGLIVAFGSQCPTVRPCTSSQVRCSNGQCRSSSSLCPVANPCALLYPATSLSSAGVRCSTGHCAQQSTACPVEGTGCPSSASYRCSNGQCVVGSSSCPSATPLQALPSNGCPTSSQYKCLDGSCQSSYSNCPAANGCPASKPFLCADGTCLSSDSCTTSTVNTTCASGLRCPSGLCADDWSSCTMTNGCPVSTPVRCADGSCKQLPASGDGNSAACATTIVCDAATPYLCADKTCVSNSTYCRSISPCPISYTVLCSGFVCRTSGSTCASDNLCPPMSPVLCPDGACARTSSQCSSQTQTACATGQIRCFDGVCRDNALGCAAAAWKNYKQYADQSSPVDFSVSINHGNSTCPNATNTICPDGTCVTSASQCGLVAACPVSMPMRCPNGACINASVSTCEDMSSYPCESGSSRCEDGLCRTTCLPYAGCSTSEPYACFGRSTACTATRAACVSGSTFANRRLLSDTGTASTGQEACVDCENAVVATPQTVKIFNGKDLTIDVSVDTASVPRTQLYLPSGIFGSYASAITITPVSPAGLSFDVSPTSESSMDAGPFLFSTNVLSTPFNFSLDNSSATILGNITVYAAINNIVYNSDGSETVMDPADICLASVDDSLGTWACLEPSRTYRLANPTWTSSSGRMQTRVAGLLTVTTSAVLAFAYIPMPAAATTAASSCGVWCQYEWVILGIVIGFSAFGICMAYVIWRFKRYRDKYREQKMHVEQLREYAREIDENRGGLGVADDEVVMMANPMVVEMQKLDAQLNAINLQMDTQREKDTRTIEQLSQDREKLHMEIQRVKSEMAAQQKTTATRLEEVHIPQSHIDAPSVAPGLVPMETEGGEPRFDDAVSSGPISNERHGFAQVRRPARRKEDF